MESLLERDFDVHDETEALVLEWRVETLRRAGFDGEAALDLALCKDVDLHAAVRLTKRGCPHATALRILL